MTWNEIEEMDRNTLKRCIREYDNALWEKGFREKKVLSFYAREKSTVGYEFCYKNDFNSKLYARARVNALQMKSIRTEEIRVTTPHVSYAEKKRKI